RTQDCLQLGVHQQHGHTLGGAADHAAATTSPQRRGPLDKPITLVARQDQAKGWNAGPVVLKTDGDGHSNSRTYVPQAVNYFRAQAALFREGRRGGGDGGAGATV